ncbi:CBS domain-containing protein [Paenibacillus endophyticus]|uniref:CBS domain-containing protein n=1 Tax=Paenibacillus endophyticus TaxID=1294268 RepID=A0A7W5CAS5_9BACL|nr:CBS domain-containing protein [Paenibacillus endophyticus]MBB3153734.1 CBS domain-containing protein [Paenibacillus endophyticus]
MNIQSFLHPKDEVSYLITSSTMKEALDKLEASHYTAIPILDDNGLYFGTLSEGDLLWKLKATPGLTFDNMHDIPVVSIKKRMKVECVEINADLDDMLALAADQNFVPVVDADRVFLGIIRRKDIIEYYTRNIAD